MDHIIEFYGSTEGNFGIINIDNKPGPVGALPLFVPSIQNVTILKLHPETGDYLRDENGFCVECGVSEPGETVCEITKVSPFYGYRNNENSAKKILRNCFKAGDAFSEVETLCTLTRKVGCICVIDLGTRFVGRGRTYPRQRLRLVLLLC